MALLKNIQWTDNSKNLIVYKYAMEKDQVNKGSALTVREGQVAIFVYKGKLADVFLPGFYKLDTDNMPILTKLLSWKYGFQTPFHADIYFVNTTQFTNQKWGTSNPILIRDKDYGAIRLRGFGTYSFKVDDAYVFMQNLSGTSSNFEAEEITDYLRSLVVSGISDAIGETKIPVLEMAANLQELSTIVQNKLDSDFKNIGIKLTKFNFENVSLPEELEKALDKNATLGVYRNNMDVYTQMQTLEAMKNASNNQGTLGGAMGAGLGMHMGMNMSNMLNNNMNKLANNQQNPNQNTKKCTNCGAEISVKSKFCSECGSKTEKFCKNCGTVLKANAKFCSECGEKV